MAVVVVGVCSAVCSDGDVVDTTITTIREDTMDIRTTIRMVDFVDYPNSSTTSAVCPASTATVPHIHPAINGISVVQCIVDKTFYVLQKKMMQFFFTNCQKRGKGTK